MLLPSGKEYVAYLKAVLRDDKIDEAVSFYRAPKVPNRPASDTRLSKWYRGLGPKDMKMVERVMRDVLDRAISTWLLVLDKGIGSDGDLGRLELYSKLGRRKNLINNPKHKSLEALYRTNGYLDYDGKFHAGRPRKRRRK